METFNSGLFIDEEFLADYAATEAKLLGLGGTCRSHRSAAELRRDYAAIRRCRDTAERRYGSMASPPAACEWLLDNWYMVRREYLSALPAVSAAGRLRQGSERPLINELCEVLLSSGGGRISEERCTVFLRGFQTETVLTQAELGLFPAVMRQEILRKLAEVCLSMSHAADTEKHAAAFEALFSSLRLLSAVDINSAVQKANVCGAILARDPAGQYTRMDEDTRLDYLSALARLAESRGEEEHVLAEKLIRRAAKDNRHIGFYLFADNKTMRPGIYIAANILLTLFITLLTAFAIPSAAAAFLLLLPVSKLVKGLIDYTLLHISSPRRLPRMSTENGIGEDCRTICVISAILGSVGTERLEELRLASRREGRNLSFGLLADYPAAPEAHTAEDAALLRKAAEGIEALNRKYGGGFYLFTRERQFNGTEYSGHERKRGAIMELARLIRGRESTLQICGDREALRATRYIITLDTDTRIYPGALGELIGAAAHPLCRPSVDRRTGRVVSGHAILHPRIATELESANATDFALIYAGCGGSDPYTGIGAELYMDCFDNGGFAGKGIIDAEAMLLCLDGKLPEGRILSHDALEGAYLHGGYMGDCSFSDEFPARPLAYFRRMHRWVRGDWQNAPWIFSRELTAIDRFRLFDSLRRSLTPPMTFIAIISGFFIADRGLTVAAWAALLSLLSELIVSLADGSTAERGRFHLRRHTRLLTGTGGAIVRCFTGLWLLPNEAWVCFSAAVTALWRMTVSGKNLLQWQTSAQSGGGRHDLAEHIRAMLPAVFIGTLTMVFSPVIIGKTAGFMWLLSPVAAYALALPARKENPLSDSDMEYIRNAAAQSWKYLESFSGEEDNFLPPDNFQEQPPTGTAHRTSPTNIGLAMAAACACADMEIISKEQAAEYNARIVAALEKLPRDMGHLYNWYDTRSLQPLRPAYISTVDSGNLYAGLLVTAASLSEWGRRDIAIRIERLMREMDFSPLYDKSRDLFYICYDTVNRRGAGGWYDLMASEARLTSYLAVAKGDVPVKHWRMLSRAQLQKDGYQGLASWTGTMFEYLMPELFLPLYRNSLLCESAKFCLYAQKKRAYAGKPWGISESAFYSLDPSLSYRYKAHGCPALALKRGQEQDMVISPYSSFLALVVDPVSGAKNLRRLEALGAVGRFGFIEALDFTPGRSRSGSGEQVRCYMAHHVSMSILSAANAICGGIIQRRFINDSAMRAHTLLLQEHLPTTAAVIRRDRGDIPERPDKNLGEHWQLRGGAEDNGLKCSVLSNGAYNIMLTNRFHTSADYGELCIYKGSTEESGLNIRLNGKTLSPAVDASSWFFREEQAGCRLNTDGTDCAVLCSTAAGDCGELRHITLKSREKKRALLELDLKPVLARLQDYINHPAYWQLGIERAECDGALLLHRIARGSCGNFWLCLKCSVPAEYGYGERDTDGTLTSPAARVSAELYLPAGESREIKFALCVSTGREEALAGADRILDAGPLSCGNMVGAAAIHLGMTPEETGAAMALVRPLWENPISKAAPKRALWQYGISGDTPIICCDGRAAEADKLLKRFCLLKSCGVNAELIYFSSEQGEYVQPLMRRISATLAAVGLEALIGSRGGVYIVPSEAKEAVQSRAAVIIGGEEKHSAAMNTPVLNGRRQADVLPEYTLDGSDFRFEVNDSLPPRAWQHILTNGVFGCIAADCGCGYMWYKNAREMRINLPSEDIHAVSGTERIYIEHGGKAVSLFAANDGFPCAVTFSPGFARWEKKIAGKNIVCTAFIPEGTDARLLRISGAEGLRLYWELECVMGGDSGAAVRCAVEDDIVVIENPESYFSGTRFLMASSGRMKAELPGQGKVRLGIICDRETVLACGCCEGDSIFELCRSAVADELMKTAARRWKGITGGFTLETGDRALESFMSTWGAYQCIACRIEGRSSLYQSGGATGFRDQLQDSINMLLISPEYAKAQILACCAHQYVEGDVMHWWHAHPEGDRGVRTRCSDDMLWLCLALCEYCRATGDYDICKQEVEYITSRPLTEHERDRYEIPERSGAFASVIDHAAASLECCISRGFGEHGLPWFGSGDWNDALDNVDGESVWLGWFFSKCAEDFAVLSDILGRKDAERYRRFAAEVGQAAENSWNGSSYRRGYYADGSPLGGDKRIDSLSQSWAAMSSFADIDHVSTALNLSLCRLVDKAHGVVKLFTPPYSAAERSPGYITAYGEGVRENGGQYTHGAVWLALALLKTGRRAEGYDILRMLLPDGHDMAVYEAEPFVLAADVSSAPGHEGRAGWTWYTGSAGWFFRAMTEEILGLKLRGGKLYIEPELPPQLPAYRAKWRDFCGTEHIIECIGNAVRVDGEAYHGEGIG